MLKLPGPKVAGIDGCRAGWIAFLDDGASVTPHIIRSDGFGLPANIWYVDGKTVRSEHVWGNIAP